LDELRREAEAIYRTFPELRKGPLAAGNPTAGVRGDVEGLSDRRRPKMSREARKRIAEAQRKRWAEWKARKAEAAVPRIESRPSRKAAKKR
jgi:hypothetical protein